MDNKESYGIVGGGLLGLSLALKLAKKGKKVTVIEAEHTLGGLASSWKIGELTWDKYYHVILMSDLHLRKLLDEIGIENEICWTETKTGFYTNGKLYSMSNTLEFLKFPPLNLIDKLRLGFTIFYASKLKNWKKLEKIGVEQWLKKLSGKRTFNKIWLPLLKAKLGESYKEASAAFIWATIQRMYAARKSGLKKEMFGYVQGGYARIIESLHKKVTESEIEIVSGFNVKSIRSVENKIEILSNQNLILNFEKCVVTLPSKVVSQVCLELSDDIKIKHQNLTYLGVICVTLLLKNSVSPYYVTNITDDWVPFTGIIEMSALVDKKTFNSNALIYLPKYLSPDNEMFAKPDNEIIEDFVKALIKMYPSINMDDILESKVARAKNVFALSTLNYSNLVPTIKTNIKGLDILNSAQITNGTLNVNETIQLADKYINNYLD
jgi:protoporphyrinogen oxidase